MFLLGLTDLRPGMMLAADVRNRYGRLIASRGTALTAERIRVFKIWGVVEVEISGEKERGNGDGSSKKGPCPLPEDHLRSLEKRLMHTDRSHPAIRTLMESLTSGNGGNGGFSKCSGDWVEALESVKEPSFMPVELRAVLEKILQSGHRNMKLPALPEVFLKINEAVSNPRSSVGSLADLIGRDTSLTASLLRIANSSFYGFPNTIETLARAVDIIGFQQISTLCYGIQITRTFRHVSTSAVDMKSFWKHSIACGLAARFMASQKGIRNCERLFVAGLLHDIGKLTLLMSAPEAYCRVLAGARSTQSLLFTQESEQLGMDHGEIGGHLTRQWKFPASLEDLISHHHRPEEAGNPLEAGIIHVADIIVNAAGFGGSGEAFIPPLNERAWETLDLSIHAIPMILNQTKTQMNDTIEFFFP